MRRVKFNREIVGHDRLVLAGSRQSTYKKIEHCDRIHMIPTTDIIRLLYKHRSWAVKELVWPLGLFLSCLAVIGFLRGWLPEYLNRFLLLLMIPTVISICWVGLAAWRITDKLLKLEPELSEFLNS